MDLSWVDRLAVDLEPWDSGVTLLPEVALWDWSRERWTVETVGWGANEIPAPHRYVSDQGAVRLELRNGGDMFVELRDVTVTIRGQR